jgi:hypothetical protein
VASWNQTSPASTLEHSQYRRIGTAGDLEIGFIYLYHLHYLRRLHHPEPLAEIDGNSDLVFSSFLRKFLDAAKGVLIQAAFRQDLVNWRIATNYKSR